MIPYKVIKAATENVKLSVTGEGVLEREKRQNRGQKALPLIRESGAVQGEQSKMYTAEDIALS